MTGEDFVRPLEGVRVIDMTTYLAGPLGAKMLSDLGAEVIKVETPLGDPYRKVGPMRGDTSIYWINANGGKRAVTIDLKSPDGLELMKKLLVDADLFIENSKPQVAAKLGLSQEMVGTLNPRLIRLSLTGYGPDGPLSSEPVYDALLQGRTGLFAFEAIDGKPRATNQFMADKVCATFVCQMALAGLVRRGRTGTGMHLQGSMLDIMAYYGFPDMLQHRTFLDDTRAWSAPPSVVVETKGGHMVLSPVTGKQLSATLELVGAVDRKDELRAIADSRQRTYRFFEIIAEPLKQRTAEEWLPLFKARDVPVAPVNSPDEGLEDAQILHNRVYGELDTPAGRLRTVRYPMTVDGHRLVTMTPAPAHGQDNEALL